MRYVKALGVALVATVAVVACAGVGTASATVLCKATESPCAEANRLEKGKEIKGDIAPTAGSVLFQSTEGVTLETCSGSTLTTTVEKPGGASETTLIGLPKAALTWSGCTKGVETKSSGEFEVHYNEGTDNGTVTNTKTLFGPWFEISIYKGECVYLLASQEHIGVITGGAGELTPPKFEIATILRKKEGGASCLSDIWWKVFYSITEPNPLYVRPS